MGDRIMNQLLTEIDGVGAKKNVFFVGATNRPELLDDALLRPGRLDQLIYIPLPDKPARQGILESTLKKSPIAPNVSLAFMAELTDGSSAADELKTDDMDVDTASEITRKHFEEAMGGARKSVAQTDLAKYDQFRQKMQPTYNQGGGGTTINWPDDPVIGGTSAGGAAAVDDDEDDLYS